jgi:hypothetical protein
MSAAQRFDLNLATQRDQEVISGTQGALVATVRCTNLPAAAQLSFGQGGAKWDLEAFVDYRPCPPERNGIYITNLPAGGTLTLMVTMAEGEVASVG